RMALGALAHCLPFLPSSAESPRMSASWNSNLTADRPTFVTHLECAMTGERYEADTLHGLSRAGRPLLVRYDLAAAREALTKAELSARPMDLWRYREWLPVRDKANVVSLGEIVTPLVPLPRS